MTQKIYHAGTLHYRRLPVLLSGMALAAFCSYFLFRLFPHWVAAWCEPGKLVLGLFLIGIVGFLAISGAWLVRSYLTDLRLELRIDTQGVSYGRRFYPWAEVGSLSGRWRNGRVQLLLHRQGRIALDRHLITDVAMTEDEYARLMERLDEDLGELYPHLEIG